MDENNSVGEVPAQAAGAVRQTRITRHRGVVKAWRRMKKAAPVWSALAATASAMVAAGALLSIRSQIHLHTNALKVNTQATISSIRAQLYQTENDVAKNEVENDYLNTVWAVCPPGFDRQDRAVQLLSIITDDQAVLQAESAGALYNLMFQPSGFSSDSSKRLRALFLHAQTILYHAHNAFDYKRENALTEQEWKTWKGIIGEMDAHPMLMVAIWQGYQNRYFSQKFAQFLKAEICSLTPPSEVKDIAKYERGRLFAAYYYPEMQNENWEKELPDY